MSQLDDILTESLPAPLKEFLGDAVTYRHMPAAVEQAVTAIFSDPAPESGYPGVTTIAEFLLSDLTPTPTEGDEVVFNAATYTVFDVKRDGVGPDGLFARLAMKKRA